MPTNSPATMAMPISRAIFGDDGVADGTAGVTSWPPLDDWAVVSWSWLSCDFKADCCW